MKGVINGFDMDSGLDAWRKKKEADTGKTLKGYEIVIGKEGEKTFSLEKYRKAQAQSTQWMADRSARMVECLQSSGRDQHDVMEEGEPHDQIVPAARSGGNVKASQGRMVQGEGARSHRLTTRRDHDRNGSRHACRSKQGDVSSGNQGM